MKQALILLSAVLLLGLFAEVNAQKKSDANRLKVIFEVSMECNKCVAKIEKNIAFEKGVKKLNVSLEKKQVEIEYDARKTDIAKLQAALVALDFEVLVVFPTDLKSLNTPSPCCI